ncbi:hypothetical protein [Rhizobium sp. OAE497]|uniref:hypothetical protein n=1 Tax=Rhizobium sp. OAE497 TaxID=2663796 RepID=UPI0018F7923A
MDALSRKTVGIEDSKILVTILDQWCAANPAASGGSEARAKAEELVDWFEFGISDANELVDLFHRKHWQVSTI